MTSAKSGLLQNDSSRDDLKTLELPAETGPVLVDIEKLSIELF